MVTDLVLCCGSLAPFPSSPSASVSFLPLLNPIQTGCESLLSTHPHPHRCQGVGTQDAQWRGDEGLRTRVRKAGAGSWMVPQRDSCTPSDFTAKHEAQHQVVKNFEMITTEH